MKLLLLVCAATLAFAQAVSERKVVCYWGTWSVYRNGHGKFDISDLDATLCTHLIYSFVKLGNTGEVECFEANCDQSFARFNQLRQQNPSLKTMVAIGGWNEGSEKYSQAASNPVSRRKFVESVVAFVKKHGFDGFDVDWEYPAQRGGAPADKQNYVLMLKELRECFDRERFILSAAVGASEWSASSSYDIPQISKYLDFINLMAYDFHGPWETQIGAHSAVYPSSSESGAEANLNAQGVIKYWLAHGAPAEKLILGVPFYGKSFTLQSPQSNRIGSPSQGIGSAGPYTGEGGLLGYNEICEKIAKEGWNVELDHERRVPYAFSGNQWVSYDDVKSLKEKSDLIKSYNLGGAMIWSVDTDDFRGNCGEEFPLLKTLNRELRNGVSAPPSVPRPKGESQKGQSKPQYKPNNTQENVPSYSEPKHPQKLANNGQICQIEGYKRDSNDCSKFYYCVPNGESFTKSEFTCPPNLVFNHFVNACDWQQNVQC